MFVAKIDQVDTQTKLPINSAMSFSIHRNLCSFCFKVSLYFSSCPLDKVPGTHPFQIPSLTWHKAFLRHQHGCVFGAMHSNYCHCYSSSDDNNLLILWKLRAKFLASTWVPKQREASVSLEIARYGVGRHSTKPGIFSKSLGPSGSPHQGRS